MHYRVQIATSRYTGSLCYMEALEIIKGYKHIKLVNENPDVFISVLYDKLLTPEFIKSVPYGCYNFHPGILPDYRGAGYYSWAIINGEQTAGITLHRIDGDIDSGKIIDIRRFPISKVATGQSLHAEGCEEMRIMFRQWFANLINRNLQIKDKPNIGGKLYTRKDIKEALDLSDRPMEEWNLYIRAFQFDNKDGCYVQYKKDKFYLTV